MKKNARIQFFGFGFLYLAIIVAVLTLGAIIYFITVNGIKVINWEFLTRVPRRAMTQGGIAPALVGTFYLTIGAILFALPMGLACAIYLTEYSPKSSVVNIIRVSINNLAGVPSVVFGFFWFDGVRQIFRLWSFDPFRQPDAGYHDPAGNNLSRAGGADRRATITQRSFAGTGGNAVANYS
jgi:ABC-type phosphate transport system permease subunit